MFQGLQFRCYDHTCVCFNNNLKQNYNRFIVKSCFFTCRSHAFEDNMDFLNVEDNTDILNFKDNMDFLNLEDNMDILNFEDNIMNFLNLEDDTVLAATELQRRGHVAVRLDHYILIVGGECVKTEQALSTRAIWIFNLYTDVWRKFVTLCTEDHPPSTIRASAIAIGQDVYLFGGYDSLAHDDTNALWKLSRISENNFSWFSSTVDNNIHAPSPRYGHSGWEHEEKLWIFGGSGVSPTGYLNDNGDFDFDHNNQLLCFDPSEAKWSNPQCSGSVPTPRKGHTTTRIKNIVWMFGGYNRHMNTTSSELYQLDMHSLTWTQIQTDIPKPQELYLCTLTAVSGSKLILHAGEKPSIEAFSETWILDLVSQTWKKYTPQIEDHSRCDHSGSIGMNNSVVIIGGLKDDAAGAIDYTTEFHIMLEPKSLQQLAARVIHKHKSLLQWKCLPKKLMVQLNLTSAREDSESTYRPSIIERFLTGPLPFSVSSKYVTEQVETEWRRNRHCQHLYGVNLAEFQMRKGS